MTDEPPPPGWSSPAWPSSAPASPASPEPTWARPVPASQGQPPQDWPSQGQQSQGQQSQSQPQDWPSQGQPSQGQPQNWPSQGQPRDWPNQPGEQVQPVDPTQPGSPWPPAPPRGPGVRVPFAAPPTERNTKRMWITIGVGGAVLLLCCAGGVAGLGVLAVATGKATTTEARTTVRDFLDGLARRDYRHAYDQVCASRREDQTLAEFTAQERALPAVEGFTVAQPVAEGSELRVPAQVRTVEGTTTEEYLVITDRQAGALKVCGGPR